MQLPNQSFATPAPRPLAPRALAPVIARLTQEDFAGQRASLGHEPENPALFAAFRML